MSRIALSKYGKVSFAFMGIHPGCHVLFPAGIGLKWDNVRLSDHFMIDCNGMFTNSRIKKLPKCSGLDKTNA